jgi:hypothetical protein
MYSVTESMHPARQRHARPSSGDAGVKRPAEAACTTVERQRQRERERERKDGDRERERESFNLVRKDGNVNFNT